MQDDNQLIDISEDSLLIKDSSGQERRISIDKIDNGVDSITSSVNYPINRYKVIRNILLILLLFLSIWNYTSNYPEIKIMDITNASDLLRSGYGYYGNNWVGEKYQPGGKGTSLYTVYEKRYSAGKMYPGGLYYNKRLDFYLFLILMLFFFGAVILLLSSRISKYQYQYQHNLHTITIFANEKKKHITVGNYEETKQAYIKLKRYKKELAFK